MRLLLQRMKRLHCALFKHLKHQTKFQKVCFFADIQVDIDEVSPSEDVDFDAYHREDEDGQEGEDFDVHHGEEGENSLLFLNIYLY